MKITNLAIQNRIAVIVLTVLLSIIGLAAYVAIPKESAPQIEFATIIVTTVYPGASPDDIESIITQEIENEIASIDGIDELRSTSTEGVSTVVITFLPDVEVDDAKIDVRDGVDRAKAEFPSDVEEPIVSELDTSEFPIININLAADYSLAQLRDVAEDLQDELEGIAGVLEVNLIGGLEREVQVNVDLNALQGYNLTFNDVIDIIRQENSNIPGGSVDIDRLNYLVRIDGEFEDPSEIEALVVKAENGAPIYVRDVAEIEFGFKDRTSYSRLEVFQIEQEDGEFVPVEEVQDLQVITLVVKKKPGENIIETVDAVQEAVDTYPLPTGTEVTFTGNEADNVKTLVEDLENNIIAGIIFVIAVLLFFLGVRNATLVGIAIPLSMFLSFIIFSAMGQTLNFIILFSLIIALGMLVDNAVVIVENIYRYREEGYDRWEAAKLGTGEVGAAVAASTATTVAAFAPMLLWPGIIGKFMSYLPLTLIVTLSASLFVALIINPVITGYLVRLDGEEQPKKSKAFKRVIYGLVAFTALLVLLTNWKTFVFVAVAVPVLYLLHTRFLDPVARRFQHETLPRITERYRAFLGWMLERDYTVKHAMLRNTLALGSFTVGALLLIVGAAVGAVSELGSLVVMVPAGVLLAVGVIGILVHAFESAFIGRKTSIKAGLIVAAIIGALLFLLFLGGRIDDPIVVVELLILPAFIVVAGVLGLFFAGDRKTLILTDNRARLLTSTLSLLVAIPLLFVLAPTGVEFFPNTDPNMVQVNLEAPLGTNIEASNRVAQTAFERIQGLVEENPAAEANTRDILTNVGVGGDAMFGGGSASPEQSRITLNMVDYAQRAEPSSVTLRRLRNELQGIPGVETSITKDENGPPTGAPVNIEVSGEEFETIVRIAKEVKARLERGATEPGSDGVPPLAGLVDLSDNLNTGRPELQVNIDRERAARFGLSTSQVAQTVRAAINGIEASTYRTGEDEYDITVRLREADRADLASLQSLTILDEGTQIPLVALADISVGGGLGSITRLEQQRVVTVSGEAAEGVNGNELLGRVQTYLSDYTAELPPGYTVKYTGESEDQQESFGFLTTALLVGVSLITLILLLQFNSITNPLIIMIATGLSLIGVMLGLILTRTPFGLMTFIGVISLAGIVVNNAIVLIDYIEQLRARGEGKKEAVIDGGATRLRPVLLTAFTTIIGLVPLTFGINIDFVGLITNLDPNFQIGSENTQFWGPMGTAIISGLTFSTFLTLVIVPVMYSTFDSIALRLGSAMGSARDAVADGGQPDALVPAPAGALPGGNGFGDGGPLVERPAPRS
ncbi:MAG: efflux RND transporter permease subunit [Rhodothermales bacterium]